MNKHLNKLKGNAGETVAQQYLTRNGFEILQCNYRNKIGEIDIIAKKSDMIHFIEVKLRTAYDFGMGREAVVPHKQKTIRRVATAYLVENKLWEEVDCCFDVIEISGTPPNLKIEFFENCF